MAKTPSQSRLTAIPSVSEVRMQKISRIRPLVKIQMWVCVSGSLFIKTLIYGL